MDSKNDLTFLRPRDTEVQWSVQGPRMSFILFKILVLFCGLIYSHKQDYFHLQGGSRGSGRSLQLTAHRRMAQPTGEVLCNFILKKVPVCAQKAVLTSLSLGKIEQIIPNH